MIRPNIKPRPPENIYTKQLMRDDARLAVFCVVIVIALLIGLAIGYRIAQAVLGQ